MLKLLLEEALFEDENEEEVVDEQPVDNDEDSTTPTSKAGDIAGEYEAPKSEITDDNLDQVVDEVENSDGEEPEDGGEDLQTIEPQTTTYKVTFTLGKHTNWSRIDTVDEEDAKQQVTDYITKKWPDREFEITDVEKFVEEELEESLNESLGEIIDAQPIEDGAAVGMATVISDLIKDEYEAIEGYNSAIATAEAEGFIDMINVLTEIQAEENLHIGQLQAIMNTLDPNAHLVDDGQAEGVEQLANPLGGVNESVDRNVDIGRPDYSVDMTDDEYEDFRNVLTKHYGSPEAFFKRLHAYTPDFEIHRVDYEDIPEDTITLGSTDISQGTGNVIVYTAMGRDTGKIYRYADF